MASTSSSNPQSLGSSGELRARRSSPAATRSSLLPAVVGILLGAAALGASWWDLRALLGFVALVVAGAALDLAAVLQMGGLSAARGLLAASGVAFVVMAHWKGEPSMGMTAALVVIGVASASIMRGLRPDSLQRAAVTILGAIYLGLPGSFAILLRQGAGGYRLILAFALVIAGYHLGLWVGVSRLGGRAVAPSISASPTWWGLAFGVAGSLVASLISLTFTPPTLVASTAATLGAIVAVGALIGDLGGRLIRLDAGITERRSSVPGLGGILFRLDTLIVSLPAFYYGSHLYLM